jgi:two-component system sensor histidine kinase KdpD
MQLRERAYDGALVLPAGFTALLVLGATAAGLHGHLGPDWILAIAGLVTAVVAAIAEVRTIAPMVGISWLTVTGFSRPPYAQLQTTAHRGLVVAVVLVGCAVVPAAAAAWSRRLAVRRLLAEQSTLVGVTHGDSTVEVSSQGGVEVSSQGGVEVSSHGSADVWAPRRMLDLASAVGRRRQALGIALAVVGLPIATALLTDVRGHLALVDDLLLYLVAVVGITLVGGFWPAVVAAVAASLLLNWFFTPPLHHWTIDSPQNLLALLLFVTVAVTVSSIVHLAARRATLAERSRAESSALLGLARTVLSGHDTAADILDHLSEELAVSAELQELIGGRWVRVAAGGDVTDEEPGHILPVRADLRLRLFGDDGGEVTARIIEGYAVQSAAALDRERLRIQASQAEMLAAGNRMRTALLAAVSHDLRTPLASVKASVSSLRQTDVEWSEADRAELLATIEENADRLDALIANLLDMSRIQTGSLQPLLRPTSLDEIAPLALRGLDAGLLTLDIPDTLPLVVTDPGLLERSLANLVANALRYSPADRPPRLAARAGNGHVVLEVIDHGPGVPAELRERIVEPFQQLGDRRSSGGVGLGLAVARGFIESTGGAVTAAATPGGGLTMRVDLPMVESIGDRVNESA